MAEPEDNQLPEDSPQEAPEDDIEALLAQAESLAGDLAEETDVDPDERADPPEVVAGSVTGADTLGAVEQATGELDEIESLLKEAEAQAADVLGLGDASETDTLKEESSEGGQEKQNSQDNQDNIDGIGADQDRVEETPAEESSESVSGKIVSDDAASEGEASDGIPSEDAVSDQHDDAVESESPAPHMSETAADEKEDKAVEKTAEAPVKETPDATSDAGVETKTKDSAQKDTKTKKDKKTEKDGAHDETAQHDSEKDEVSPNSLKARIAENVLAAIPVVTGYGSRVVATTRRIMQNAVLELFVILDKPFAKLSPNTKKYMGFAGLVTLVMGGLMWVLPKLLESNPYLDMPPFPPVEPQ